MPSTFTYSNKSEGTVAPTVAIAPVTNYAKTSDEPNEATMTNKTATIDQPEVITYRSRKIDRVATVNAISYPCKVSDGVEYGIRLDEVLRNTDANGNILWDDPIVATLTIKHQRSAFVTDAIVTEIVSRLLGAAYDETGKKFRWGDLMRSALVPTEN